MPKAKILSEITELLHQDHQNVRELFFKFAETEDNGEKEKLCQQIITELYLHAQAEADVVYPVVKQESDDAEDMIDEAETEHRMVKYLIAELSKMDAKDEQFKAKVTVLCELVDHHVREEEKEIFKKLRESGADLEILGQEFQDRKSELGSRPLPEMAATLSFSEKNEIGQQKKKPGAQPKRRGTSIAKRKTA